MEELDVLFEDASLYWLRHGRLHVCHGAGLVGPHRHALHVPGQAGGVQGRLQVSPEGGGRDE